MTGGQVRRVVIHPDIVTDFITNIVPFGAGHLTGFAADTGGDVDKLRHLLLVVPRLRRGGETVSRGTTNNILRLVSHKSSPLHLFHVHKESFELRRLRIRITDERRQGIGNKAFFATPS